MTKVTITSRVVLNTAPQEVFAYVSDLMHHPEWSGGPLKIEPVSAGPVAVGSEYRSLGGESERLNLLRVTQYEPPGRFAFIAKDPMGDISHVFTFRPQGGGTLMERSVTATLPMLAAVIFRYVLYPRRGKPLMDRALKSLKEKFERSA